MSVQLPSQLQPIAMGAGAWDRAWYEWAWRLTQAVNAATAGVGATTARPTSATQGAQFFDTTIGRPIWWDGAAWVYSDGTPA